MNLTVGPGRYYVTLKFADTPLHPFLETDKDKKRISHAVNVLINKKSVIEKMNIADAAGGIFTAVDKTFTDIEPQNGIIEVRLTGADDKEAILQALEISPMSEYNKSTKGN